MKQSAWEMIWLILFIILLWLFFLMSNAAEANRTWYNTIELLESTAGQEITEYVEHFHRKVSVRRCNRAKRYIPYAVYYSKINELDGLLVAEVISSESGWTTNPKCTLANPKKCGRGLMQVKGVWTFGYDLNKPDEQIRAGTHVLKVCYNKCGENILYALNCYQTPGGRCSKDIWPGAKKRYKRYLRAVKRHRKPLVS